MKIVFVSSVEDGRYYLEEIMSVKKSCTGIEAIVGLDGTPSKSNRADFDDLAEKYGIKLIKTRDINSGETLSEIRNLNPDWIFVFGWSQLLKKDLLSIPKEGCIGTHPTLLPKYRGRAPVPWSIIKGLTKSGLTFFHINEGVDTGDILAQKEFDIDFADTAKDIHGKITRVGRQMIREFIPLLERGNPPRIPQDPQKHIENWPKRTPKDGLIDWDCSTNAIYNLIRAVTHPYPGAFALEKGRKVYIWSAEIEKAPFHN